MERSWISARLAAVTPFAEAKPDRTASMTEIVRLLMSSATAVVTQAQAEARADAYNAAVEDVPAWAVAAAIRAWHRGEIDEGLGQINLAFPPSAGQLSKMARNRWMAVKGEAFRLKRLLEAKPREMKKANPEMLKRLQSLSVVRKP